jgi:hypothetical protein
MSQSDIEPIHAEMTKVYGYWEEHGQGDDVSEIILCGHHASKVSAALVKSSHSPAKTRVADVWTNAFSYDDYIPPILRDESLEYAVAAGLAFPKHR